MSLLSTNSMLRIITLIFALSLLVIVDARIDVSLSRRHAPAANRMIKKRASPTGLVSGSILPANIAAGPQPAVSSSATPTSASTNSDLTTPTDSPTASTLQLTPGAKASATSASVSSTDTPSSASSSSTSPLLSLPSINSVLSALTPNNTASTSSSALSSSSSSSSSATSTSSATPSNPSPTQLAISTSDAQALSSINPLVTLTKNETAPAATAASSSSGSGTVTKLQRNTIIILIAIGASVGGAGIIWTIIRKWKFSPSRATDDRLQPIDWQPTTGIHDEHDITEKLNRNGSTRSHGSFTSGNNNHDTIVPDLPTHDFTAGPAHLAPVGGYADLQRGPSPQPDLQRGPSFRGPGEYQYEMPNPHQQYYNGAPGAPGPGAYQGGYNRGY